MNTVQPSLGIHHSQTGAHGSGAPQHWGHPRSLPSPSRAGLHHHGPAYRRNSPDQPMKPRPWIYHLCQEPKDDAGTCCEGCWVPCVLYGRTQYRLKELSKDNDPLDESNSNGCNGPCWLFCVLSTIRMEWIPAMLQQSRIRGMFNIDGTCGGDYAEAFFCTRCILMAHDREVRGRERHCCSIHSEEAWASLAISRQPSLQPEMLVLPAHTNHSANCTHGGKHMDRKPVLTVPKPYKRKKLTKIAKKAVHIELQSMGTRTTQSPVNDVQHSFNGPSNEHDREIITGRQPWRQQPKTSTRSITSKPGDLYQSSAARTSTHLPAEEEHVMIYYGDDNKLRPQRHRLADCARIRRSTPGMGDIPCYEHNLGDDEVITDESSKPMLHDLQECAGRSTEEHVDKHPEASGEAMRSQLERVSSGCAEPFSGEKGKKVSFIHVEDSIDSRSEVEVNHLAECAQIVPTTPLGEQKMHIMDDCQPIADESSTLQEHTLTDCTDVVVEPRHDLNIGQRGIEGYVVDLSNIMGNEIQKRPLARLLSDNTEDALGEMPSQLHHLADCTPESEAAKEGTAEHQIEENNAAQDMCYVEFLPSQNMGSDLHTFNDCNIANDASHPKCQNRVTKNAENLIPGTGGPDRRRASSTGLIYSKMRPLVFRTVSDNTESKQRKHEGTRAFTPPSHTSVIYPTLSSADQVNSAEIPVTKLNEHTLAKCDTFDNTFSPNPFECDSLHNMADGDDILSPTNQSDGVSDKVHKIPPPPSTPRADTPNSGRRTPSAAEAVLRSILGTLGGEPLDGSSEIPTHTAGRGPVNNQRVALDIGIGAPASSVGVHKAKRRRGRRGGTNHRGHGQKMGLNYRVRMHEENSDGGSQNRQVNISPV